MALTRKMLSAMSLESAQIDQIIEAHVETVDGLKAEIERLKPDAEKLPGVQAELDSLKQSIEGKDYDQLAQEFEDYKAEIEAEKEQQAKEAAYRTALKDANLNEKGVEKAIKYADWDDIELDDDGKLVNAKDHIKAVREEWAEYVTKTEQRGAEVQNPPAGNGDNNQPSRAAMVAKKHYEAIYGVKGDKS